MQTANRFRASGDSGLSQWGGKLSVDWQRRRDWEGSANSPCMRSGPAPFPAPPELAAERFAIVLHFGANFRLHFAQNRLE
jgi:hypothetical protein